MPWYAPHPVEGRTALVTGASRRLGRAIAERLARGGANVAVHYRRDRSGAEAAVEAIRAAGRRAEAVRADLADASACEDLVARCEAALGPLDLLVNNAAIFERTPLAALDAGAFDRHLAANARSVYLLSLHAGRRMKERGEGVIVNLADVAGARPWAAYVPYSASKAAVLNLTRGFARALAPEVRVNAVSPGPILPAEGADAASGRLSVERTLLKRWGDPSDVAEAVLLLATASYLTGVVLAVDGGRSLAD